MRKTLFYTLFALAMSAVATAGEVYPAGELLPKMSMTKSKRHSSPAGGITPHRVSRASAGAFIPVSPATKAIPVVGSGKDGKRWLLRKDEVVVPDTLLNPVAKRALSCGDPNYGVCPNQQLCCPIGGLCCKSGDCCDKGYRCCSTGECCPETHNCVTVGGIAGCCPIGQTCSSNSTTCADAGYVHCTNDNFCCRPGDTCTRDSSGKASCVSNSTGNSVTTTTTQQQQAATTTTTPAAAATTTTTTPATKTTTTTTPKAATTTTTPDAQTTTTTSQGEIPTTASASIAGVTESMGGVPTTMYNPTAITTLPNAALSASASSSSSVDIPVVGSPSGAMAITAGVGYSILVTAVSFALGHVLVMA